MDLIVSCVANLTISLLVMMLNRWLDGRDTRKACKGKHAK